MQDEKKMNALVLDYDIAILLFSEKVKQHTARFDGWQFHIIFILISLFSHLTL